MCSESFLRRGRALYCSPTCLLVAMDLMGNGKGSGVLRWQLATPGGAGGDA